MKKAKAGSLRETAVETAAVEKYLTFYIEGQLYAIPSSQVVEIIRMQPITLMPKMPDFVKGIVNLRGRIVPLIDLCVKFGKQTKEYDDRTSIVVVDTEDFNVGLIVEGVNDVADISENQISQSPTLAKGDLNRFVYGIATLENEVAMLLDLVKVLKADSADGFDAGKMDPDDEDARQP